MERSVQRLMLAAQRDTVKLEPHPVPLAWVAAEGSAKAESDVFLPYDMHETFVPLPVFRPVWLNGDTIACIDS